MKTEMDLRSKRFTKRHGIFYPRFRILFIIPLLIITFTTLNWGGSAYGTSLNARLEKERAALELLESEA